MPTNGALHEVGRRVSRTADRLRGDTLHPLRPPGDSDGVAWHRRSVAFAIETALALSPRPVTDTAAIALTAVTAPLVAVTVRAPAVAGGVYTPPAEIVPVLPRLPVKDV